MVSYHSSCESIMPQVVVLGDVNVILGADAVLAVVIIGVVFVACIGKYLKRFLKMKIFKKLLG